MQVICPNCGREGDVRSHGNAHCHSCMRGFRVRTTTTRVRLGDFRHCAPAGWRENGDEFGPLAHHGRLEGPGAPVAPWEA